MMMSGWKPVPRCIMIRSFMYSEPPRKFKNATLETLYDTQAFSSENMYGNKTTQAL